MNDNTFLVTVRASVESEATDRTMESIIRHTHFRDGIRIQDLEELDILDDTHAVAFMALAVPLSEDTEDPIEACKVIEGEEFTLCRGALRIDKVFEAIPFEGGY